MWQVFGERMSCWLGMSPGGVNWGVKWKMSAYPKLSRFPPSILPLRPLDSPSSAPSRPSQSTHAVLLASLYYNPPYLAVHTGSRPLNSHHNPLQPNGPRQTQACPLSRHSNLTPRNKVHSNLDPSRPYHTLVSQVRCRLSSLLHPRNRRDLP